MKKKMKKKDLVQMLAKLAFGSCNDAAKLLYLSPESIEQISELDLRLVSELKRGTNGSVEIKLTNRPELLKLLAELLEDDGTAAESFFRAVDSAAAAVREASNED